MHKIIVFATILLMGFSFNLSSLEITHNKISTSPGKEYGAEYFPIDKDLVLYYDSNFGEAKSFVKEDGETLILDMRSDDFIFIQDVVVKND
ncbi:MAG: hypothetical protein KAS18_06965, partial [Calditrichia bacterium]|nr:hypothetical protein [Calditrichia bacterium]